MSASGRLIFSSMPTSVVFTSTSAGPGRATASTSNAAASSAARCAVRFQTATDAPASLGLETDSIRDCLYVVDFVYRNGPTPLVAAAQELGVAVVDGRSLLVAQGALSFERWTGVSAPRRVMEDAIRDR